jgi:hypothetical protein
MADREGLNEHIAALAAHWTDAVSRLSAVPVSTKTYLAGLPDDHLKAGDAPCSSAVVGCAQHMAKTIATIQNKLRSIPSRWTAAGAAVKNNSTAP